ncbi:MAG TPA: hypothetical protein VF622_13870 [Segetibacter sp.]|jgi:hypothetical protein
MPDGIFITKTDYNAMMKDIRFIKEWVMNASKPKIAHNWLTEEEAMAVIGCKKTKLNELRKSKLEYRYASKSEKGVGRGIRISRKSIESYIEDMTLQGVNPLRKAS